LLKNFGRLNELEPGWVADAVDAAGTDADFWLKACLASRSRCFMSLCRCFSSRSSAARMSFSRFFSWSRSLLELTPKDYSTNYTTKYIACTKKPTFIISMQPFQIK